MFLLSTLLPLPLPTGAHRRRKQYHSGKVCMTPCNEQVEARRSSWFANAELLLYENAKLKHLEGL